MEKILSPTQLRDAYQRIGERIEAATIAGGRRSGSVRFVAVTKNASPDQIRTLIGLGHCDLGESRVQQLSQRAPQIKEFLARKKTLGGAVSPSASDMPTSVRWHMVGQLQRNKVKVAVGLVSLIHSLDSLRLAEEIHNVAARNDTVSDVLIQVNAACEEQKGGVAVPAVLHLAEQIDTMMHLRLRGLMTMAPYSDEPEDARSTFNRTAEIFNDIRHEKIGGRDFNILSMGMSGDFEVAIQEGANLVRIGRALFGDVEG